MFSLWNNGFSVWNNHHFPVGFGTSQWLWRQSQTALGKDVDSLDIQGDSNVRWRNGGTCVAHGATREDSALEFVQICSGGDLWSLILIIGFRLDIMLDNDTQVRRVVMNFTDTTPQSRMICHLPTMTMTNGQFKIFRNQTITSFSHEISIRAAAGPQLDVQNGPQP